MRYRIGPRSGNRLSVLGFGCMRFSKSLASSFGLGRKSFDDEDV
jgi:predicted aldo/keto reductase-like oxidoreductase